MRIWSLLLAALLTTPAFADPNWGQAGQVTGNTGTNAPNWAGTGSAPSAHMVPQTPLPHLFCNPMKAEGYAVIEPLQSGDVVPQGATVHLTIGGFTDAVTLGAAFPGLSAQSFRSQHETPISVQNDQMHWTVPGAAIEQPRCSAWVSRS